jgi:hypothetical protein
MYTVYFYTYFCGMLIAGVVLLHDNAHLHTAACTSVLLEHFNWELFNHCPYSPEQLPPVYLPEELAAITALQQQ